MSEASGDKLRRTCEPAKPLGHDRSGRSSLDRESSEPSPRAGSPAGKRLRPVSVAVDWQVEVQPGADIIVGLDAGADDYLVKPFTLTVLLARLRAHLRRRAPSSTDPAIIRLGGLTVDLAARRCLVDGREVALHSKEFDLLAALAARPGAAITRGDLMSDVWDENWYGPTKTLDVTMASLRRRLAEACAQTGVAARDAPVIVTIRGHGYRLELGHATSANDSIPGAPP